MNEIGQELAKSQSNNLLDLDLFDDDLIHELSRLFERELIYTFLFKNDIKGETSGICSTLDIEITDLLK
jgi:hypothetical protein